ncbi:MAG: M15 family metallopeptidase [Defluviitaleaceae bacterium]|nr:M15 family metallopeptidase [Defluviitaleaceae bacterium]
MNLIIAIAVLAGITVADFESVPFFRIENAGYYADFAQSNPNLTTEQVVLHVNIGLHYPFYENISYVDDPYYVRVLVNKFNRLPQDFSPTDLVEVAPNQFLRQAAAAAFSQMQTELSVQGGLELVVRSAYRSYETQTEIYNNNVATMGQVWADMWSARPGHSEHQTGLALDVLQPGMAGVSLGNANFQDTPQYVWLQENAHRFGFILSYPLGYSNITGYEYEPWHWRYIGVSTATYMFHNNIPTLDHYFATRYEIDIAALLPAQTLAPLIPPYEQNIEGATDDAPAEAEEGGGIFSTILSVILTIAIILVSLLAALVIAVFVLRHIRRKKRMAMRRSRQLRNAGYMANISRNNNRTRGSGRYR